MDAVDHLALGFAMHSHPPTCSHVSLARCSAR